jgi:hypothetical protein
MVMISFANLPSEQMIAKQREFNLDYRFFYEQLKRGYSPLNFDYDNLKHFKKMLRKLKKSKYNKSHYQILWRKSSSRRGYHLTVFKDNHQLFLPTKTTLRIRKIYGDCMGRICCDKQRVKVGLAISILFNSKNSKTTTAWRDLNQLKL